MIGFLIAAAAIAVLTAALMYRYSQRPVAVPADPAQAVYRRQLSEIDDLAARGLLGEDERKSAYAEAARRLLNEPGAVPERSEDKAGGAIALAAIGATVVVGVIAYLIVGSPGEPDHPYEKRLAQWVSLAESGQIGQLNAPQALAVLEQRKEEFSGEAGYWTSLAQLQGASGDVLTAERSLERATALAPNDARAWEQLGVVRYELAEGRVTPKVRAALDRAVALNPSSLEARYILAMNEIDSGRRDAGIAALEALLADSPPNATQVRDQLQRDIAGAQRGMGGVRGAAAADPAIQAMVSGLAARLEENPNDPEGWARLVRSYQVMGDLTARDAALDRARVLFKDRPRDLTKVEQALQAPQ